ncbi:response regulator transcription factor [Oceanicola sp. S124]|uniref:response regulator transcription factor n=1 Tax=Oceanicola sp. S124 TaxID=1042378 RepID=UPI00025579C7|nr:response regulator transcription factor [Oceanicola sp. S124]
MTGILFIDDHALLRDTLSAWLRARGLTVTCCDSLEDALSRAVPDLIILDLRLKGLQPRRDIARLQAAFGKVPVLITAGAHDASQAADLCAAGAAAVLGKSLAPQVVLDRIGEFLGREPRPRLSPREVDVLTALAAGLSNKEIARDLGLQEVTVKLHMQRLSRKLGARNRTQAALIGRDMGLL